VRVTAGAAYDVVVDLRRASPCFGHAVGIELSEENHRMLWIPPGFAHGFVATSEQTTFIYKTTDYWYPQFERIISWRDPDLAIKWPLPAGVVPLLSARDAQAGAFRDAEYYE
jgi:dTDP-4-dehydrorhamnose 3,5-epimerase